MTIRKDYLIPFLILFLIELSIGIFVHDAFIRPFVGDVLVVVLLYFLLLSFFPIKTRLLPLYIFLFAVLVELGQLVQVLQLLGMEDNKLARIVFGATFDLKDVLCYLIGCILLLLYQRRKKNA